ncbi:MAG: hypothetical protein U1E21_01690 [Reyranellaceae bacterium]
MNSTILGLISSVGFDGHPFTTEDFPFYSEDVTNNTSLSKGGPAVELGSRSDRRRLRRRRDDLRETMGRGHIDTSVTPS